MTLHTASNGMMTCIARIMRAGDRQGIEAAIEAVEQINMDLAHDTGTDPADIRRMIREGFGVFGDVAGKCRKWGVV